MGGYGLDRLGRMTVLFMLAALLTIGAYWGGLTELVARGKLIHSDTIAAYNDMIRQGVSWRDK